MGTMRDMTNDDDLDDHDISSFETRYWGFCDAKVREGQGNLRLVHIAQGDVGVLAFDIGSIILCCEPPTFMIYRFWCISR